jgi:hypothetical protein
MFLHSWSIKRMGFRLQHRWTEKNIDLGLLYKSVGAFFTERGLKAKTEKSSGKYNVFLFLEGGRSPAGGLATKRLAVSIARSQNGFAVEFRAVDYTRSILFRNLAQLFIGGLWFRRDRELEDVLLRLENEFWSYMDETIARLSESSKQETRGNDSF